MTGVCLFTCFGSYIAIGTMRSLCASYKFTVYSVCANSRKVTKQESYEEYVPIFHFVLLIFILFVDYTVLKIPFHRLVLIVFDWQQSLVHISAIVLRNF